MKRVKALYNLSHDHHHGLRLAQLIKKGAPDYRNLPGSIEDKTEYTIKTYETELKPHFIKEEDILFKLAKGKNAEVDLLIDEIIFEHKKIAEIVELLKTGENNENSLNELGNLLADHIRKEERNLFMKIQNLLSDDELKEAAEKMDNFIKK